MDNNGSTDPAVLASQILAIRDSSITDMIVDVEAEEEQRHLKRKRDEISKRPVPNHGSLRSPVYGHYTWSDDARKWMCNYCPCSYTHASKGGSASLLNHLKTTHSSLVKSDGVVDIATGNPGSLVNFYKRSPKPAVQDIISEEGFKTKLMDFIVCTDQPFSVVAESTFINLIAYSSRNNSKTQLPCPSTIRNWIGEAYATQKTKLKDALLNNEGRISIILDAWTSSNQRSFQGVIACWINNDWKLCHSTLDLTILEGSHSGANMASAFETVLDEFQLWTKLLAITTDNASNMDTMFKKLDEIAIQNMSEFSSNEYRIRCLAHIVNLVCKDIIVSIVGQSKPPNPNENDDDDDADDGFNFPVLDSSCATKGPEVAVKGFLANLRKAISTIRSSPQRRELFDKHCVKFNIKPKNLILDCDTRWNSTLAMLQRALEFKQPFLSTAKLIKKLNGCGLENEDVWRKVEKMIEVLKPFEEATKLISQGHSPTLSDTESIYQYLFKHLENYTEETDHKILSTRSRTQTAVKSDDWLRMAIMAGWEKLTKYYSSSEALVYVVATVMDPRYKLNWFQVTWKKQFFERAKTKVTQLWLTKYKNIGSTAKESTSSTAEVEPLINCGIKNLVSEKMQKYHKQDDELKRYLQEAVTHPDHLSTGIDGALSWWKSHETDYPALSRMAKDFLSASATGVPVERLFSSGPDLLTARRQRLSPESIKQCMCLKQWLKAKDSVYFLDGFKDALKDKLGSEI